MNIIKIAFDVRFRSRYVSGGSDLNVWLHILTFFTYKANFCRMQLMITRQTQTSTLTNGKIRPQISFKQILLYIPGVIETKSRHIQSHLRAVI